MYKRTLSLSLFLPMHGWKKRPGTQMALVLKGLLLEGSNPTIEDKRFQVHRRCIYLSIYIDNMIYDIYIYIYICTYYIYIFIYIYLSCLMNARLRGNGVLREAFGKMDKLEEILEVGGFECLPRNTWMCLIWLLDTFGWLFYCSMGFIAIHSPPRIYSYSLFQSQPKKQKPQTVKAGPFTDCWGSPDLSILAP